MKVGNKIGMMSVAAMSIMLAIFGTAYWNIAQINKTACDVEHTLKLSRQLELLLVSVADAESQGRGYLMTGNEAYLEPRQMAVSRINPTLADLKSLTANKPDQQKLLDSVENDIHTKLSYSDEYIDLKKRGNLDQAINIFRGSRGKVLMDEIRSNVITLLDQEKATFDLEKQNAEETSRKMIMIMSLATLLGFVVLLSRSYFIIQEITGSIKQLIRGADRIGSGRFEPVFTDNPEDEFGELATALNEMSYSLRNALEGSKAERQARQSIHHTLEQAREKLIKLALKREDLISTTDHYTETFAEQPALASNLMSLTAQAVSDAGSLSTLSQKIADLCRLASQSLEKEMQMGDEILHVLEILEEKTGDSNKSIQTLTEKTEQLNEIVATIEHITSGANLIAMSASIESARNSDNGLPALVSELKSLSENSKLESLKSRQMLTQISKTASAAALHGEDSARAAQEAQHRSTVMNNKLQTIEDPVAQASRLSQQLLDNSRAHTNSLKDLLHALERFELTATQMSSFSKQINSRMKEMTEIGSQLTDIVAAKTSQPESPVNGNQAKVEPLEVKG